MRGLLILSTLLVILWPRPLLANIGIPMIAIYWPPAWLALVPIILIEWRYGVRRLNLPADRALAAQATANGVSTLIGIPVLWVVLALGQMFAQQWEGWRNVPEPLMLAIGPIIGAPRLLPGAEQTSWMVPLAAAILTAFFYAMSVIVEGLVVLGFFRDVPRRVIRRWTVRGNALSYTFLLALVLAGWMLPRASGLLFELASPFSAPLVAVVMQLAAPDRTSEREPPLMRAVRSGDVAAARNLIAKGADVRWADEYGNTALHLAASLGHDVMTRLLLEAGANVGARRTDAIGYTPLHHAAWTGNAPTIRVLLAAGTRVNDASAGGWTPLMVAMLYGRPHVVEALLEGGADVNARSSTGWTALKEARFRGHREIAERLVRAGAIDYPDGVR